jgi:hypothetical protein
VTGPLNADQLEYAELMHVGTELRLAVVAAWLLCEEPPSRDPAAQGHNWLNLLSRSLGRVRGFSGVAIIGYSPAGFAMFASARDGATEASFWVNTFSNYAGIREAARARASDFAQAVAIASSPWDAGHYGRSSSSPAGRIGELLPAMVRAFPDMPPRPRHRHLPGRAWRWARWWLSVGEYRGRGRRQRGRLTRPNVRQRVPRRWWRAVRWYKRHRLEGSTTRSGG